MLLLKRNENKTTAHHHTYALWQLLPSFGSVLFVLLYFVATLFYPGGSPFDKEAKGFRWTENYWCNLLNDKAINGLHNSAKPIAFTAMVVLCLALVFFWYHFPLQVGFGRNKRVMVQASGALAMATGLFVFTGFHDVVIDVAGGFGLIAIGGTLAGLKKLQWHWLFWSGLFNLVLIALNNLCYYDKPLQVYLPVVQKITFLSFLLWICAINVSLYNKTKLRKTIPA